MSNRRWEQLGAAAGIVFVVAQVAANNLMEQVGGNEPPFYAEAPEIVDFFMTRDSRLFGLGDYLMTLAVIPFVWWLSVLWARLRRAEGAAGRVAVGGNARLRPRVRIPTGQWRRLDVGHGPH